MSGALHPTSTPFVKASACGNDFILIDGKLAPTDMSEFTRRICDRHAGVGADGVEWLFPAQDAEIEARLINADGSKAEISGNGTRCVAAFYCAEHNDERVRVRTGAGVKTCMLVSRRDTEFEFEIAMGEPKLEKPQALRLAGREVAGVPVSMGNPHYVMFLEQFGAAWKEESAEIQRQPEFPDGVNVEHVLARDTHNIEVRFFERGVGETQSSGTGSCAAAVAAIATGRAKSPVRVHAPGGAQTVRWEGEVFLAGAARLVCRGEFFI
jgi:diaminopimelate epimerase